MQIADGRTSQEKIRAKDKERKKLTRNKKPSSGHPDEEDPPGPTTEPDDEPANPLVVMWAKADPEARREFVHACWNEIARARDQVGPAKPNGNAGANHWAHLSKEGAEELDRWIEGDK